MILRDRSFNLDRDNQRAATHVLMTAWVDRTEALARLGVRAETLYAYVSRGRVERRPDPADPRRSLYSATQIDALARKRERGRHASDIAASAFAWGEPAVATSIATVLHGRLIYRGVDAVALSEHATLEVTSTLLWRAGAEVRLPRATHNAETGTEAAFVALASIAATGVTTMSRTPAKLRADAALCVNTVACAFGAEDSDAFVHERIARGWGVGHAAADVIRRALVLLADHELNASTFAARVAASTGASIAACMLAGFSALSGPRHGGAADALEHLLRDAKARGCSAAIEDYVQCGAAIPGFGHPLYPDGDPRAIALLSHAGVDTELAALRDAVFVATSALPNIDFALLALVRTHNLPDFAPFRLFAIGRSVGWAAHAMEQAASDNIIRPRARYEGVLPAD